MSSWFMRWVQSPTGPKTTHFWAPTANGFFSVQGLYDWNRDPKIISREMQFILVCYSTLFMRFAWQIRPRSYILFTVHACNFLLQGRLLSKRLQWEKKYPEKVIEQKLEQKLKKELALKLTQEKIQSPLKTKD